MDVDKYEIVSWLELLVKHQVTPETCKIAIEEMDTTSSMVAEKLLQWSEGSGLPRWIEKNLSWSSYDMPMALIVCAEQATRMMRLRAAGRQNGFKNGVELRDNLKGKKCQCCGEEIKVGEQALVGFRRRCTESNRTGYIHVKCLKNHRIDGDKLVRREIVCVSTGKKKKVGCRVSEHRKYSKKPLTHVMWVGQSAVQESVAFSFKE